MYVGCRREPVLSVTEFDDAVAACTISLQSIDVNVKRLPELWGSRLRCRAVSKDRILEKVNIEQAEGLIITIADADKKLAAILMTRALNPDIHIVAASYGGEEDWLTHAGASQIIDVNEIVANSFLALMEANSATPS